VGQTGGGDRSVSMPEDKKITANLKVTIGEQFIELFDSGKVERIPITDNVFFFFFIDQFAVAAREKYIDKKDVVIQATDNARYEHLIYVMDQFLAHEFSDLVMGGSSARL